MTPSVLDSDRVKPGTTAQVDLKVSEWATHAEVRIPVTVVRAKREGPTVYVTGAIHGDEVSGVAIVRRLLDGLEHDLVAGTVIAVPVANPFAFHSGDRYLPDRRDLNRHFPGEATGSMASRIARHLFDGVVAGADYGIDLHTAADGNTNLCHARGDAAKPKVKALMKAFGTPILVDGDGPRGSLRRAATEAGVPSIVYEAGEPGRFQRHVVDIGHAGILRVLASLDMVERTFEPPAVQLLVKSTEWIRSDHGGILDLHVEPGDLVEAGASIGVLFDPYGRHVDQVVAPQRGVVLGTTTTPLVHPGVALVHLGHLDKTYAAARRHVDAGGDLGHLDWPGQHRRS